MKSEEFLSAYRRNLTLDEIHHGATTPEIQATQLYSYGYGQILYDALQGKHEGLPDRVQQLEEYEEQVDFGELETSMLDGYTDWKYRNEVNFIGLNKHLREMWKPLVHGRWLRHNEHFTDSQFCQISLALHGLLYYRYREKYLRDEGLEVFEDPAAKTVFSRLEGAMQEYDATIILMNWAKKYPNLTVVPAPAQFEHSTKQANADLIVVDTQEGRAVGVQVKTRSDPRDRERYDPERIVVIDSQDLGNVRVMAGKGKKTETPRPWPGMIAASRVMGIKTQDTPNFDPTGIATVIRRKMEAKAMLGSLRIDYNEISRAIGERVLAKL
jgi:hypothetical protein